LVLRRIYTNNFRLKTNASAPTSCLTPIFDFFMKKITAILIITFIFQVNFSQYICASSLTRSVTISLLTQDEGDELYAYFGHTAIRVKDDSLGVDQVYNYGTFDFNTPNFYTRFIKGDLNYCLSIDSYSGFIYTSKVNKRTIREQVLELSFEEKYEIVMLLETCYNTSERYYLYDFLDNNCATKIRDIIYDGSNGRIDFGEAKFGGKTYRQLLQPFLEKDYWIDFGINFILGLKTDEKANANQYMFLPIYIHDFLADSEFAGESTVILDATPQKKDEINFSYVLPWILALALSTLIVWKRSRKFMLYLLSVIFTLLGLLILSLGLYSDHDALIANLNMLWTLPALFVLILGHTKKMGKYIKCGYLILILLHFINWFWLPQQLSPTFLPWMLLMTMALAFNLEAWRMIKCCKR
jgi:hypothetical protein